jgi:hypothetical protein
MRRLLTAGIVAGLCALVLAAALDAILDRGAPKAAPPPPAPQEERETEAATEDRAALAGRLERLGVAGTLYLSPPACGRGEPRPLRAVRLPSLRRVDAPAWSRCRFSLSPDGSYVAAAGSTWQPAGEVVAAEGERTIEVTSPSPTWGFRFPGDAPSFRPDASLTYVHRGEVVEWTRDCGAGDEVATFLGDPASARCPRTLVSRADLARAFRFDSNIPTDRRFVSSYSVEDIAWSSESRLFAVLAVSVRFGPPRERLLAVFEGRRAVAGRPGLASRFADLRASPDGRLLAMRSGDRVEVLGRRADTVWPSALEPVRSFAWSPDGKWLAVATRASVYLVQVEDWTVLVRLPFSTHDVAWR